MRTEDGSIIYRCLNGEPGVFGLLVDKYKAGIYAYVYTRLLNFQDAQDVTQEVFLQAYRDLHSLRRWESFVFWLYRIAHNCCAKSVRARSRRPDSEFIEDQNPGALADSSLSFYREDQVDESLREAIYSLPDTYRQVLMLHYFGGMNSSEIAKSLGASPTAIRMRLSRARAQLKEEMVAMMGTAFEGQRLQANFTFRIVEAVRRIKVNPMPRAAGLPWGLSLAAGIIIAVLSFSSHVSILNLVSFPKSSPQPMESGLLRTGEIPVEILTGSQILDTTGKRNHTAKAIIYAKTRADSNDGQVLFVRGGFGKDWEMWVMDADGKGEKLLDNGANPVWSPDGKHIVFYKWKAGDSNDSDIYIMDANGSNVKCVTGGADNEICPTWSPDGKQIAYNISNWKEKNGNWEVEGAVCVMNADGTNIRNLTGTRANFSSYYVDYSPDGKMIAYEDRAFRPDGGLSRSTQIWVMDVDGKNQRMLTTSGYGPDWSPDGKRIVFESYRDGWNTWQSSDIYVMDADGANVKRLTDPGPSSEWYPKWSPDGTKIAFCSDGDDLNSHTGDIYIMNADGTDTQQLTNTPDNEAWVDWTAFSHAVNPAHKLPTKWGKVKSNSQHIH